MEFKGLKSGIEFSSWWGPFVPLGVALLVGFLIALGGGLVLSFPFRMALHELGHASASWFTGHAALPLPFVTFWAAERSAFVILCMVFLIGVFLYRCVKDRAWPAVGFGAFLLCVLAWGCLLGDDSAEELRILGGLLGELLLPAVIFVFYPLRVPTRFRWDFWRFLVVFPAALTFFPALFLWMRARSDASHLPRGSLFGDDFGDVERLLGNYGWTEREFASFFLTVGLSVLFAVIAHLAVQLFLAYRAGDPPPPAPPSPPVFERRPQSQRPSLRGPGAAVDLPPPWDLD